MLQIIDTGTSSAEENMALDTKYLETLTDTPILHFYDWKGNSATYGYFIVLEKHLNTDAMQRYSLSAARRPTGGGIVFHVWDYAFSFLMPSNHPFFSLNSLANYQFVNTLVLEAVQEVFSLKMTLTKEAFSPLSPDCRNFCMARPTEYDVIYQGFKVAGAAQRRTKRGYLHQGTISLGLPREGWLADLLVSDEAVASAMQSTTFAPLGANYSDLELSQARDALEIALGRKFMGSL